MKPFKKSLLFSVKTTASVFALTLILFFLEWLFEVTRTSYLSNNTLLENILIFILASSFAIAAFFALLMFLSILFATVDFVFRRRSTDGNPTELLGPFPAELTFALLASILFMLLLDNFTLTLFQVGIRDLDEAGRILYLAAIFVLFIAVFRRRWKRLLLATPRQPKISKLYIVLSTLAFLVMIGTGRVLSSPGRLSKNVDTGGQTFPNVLLIGVDGLEGER